MGRLLSRPTAHLRIALAALALGLALAALALVVWLALPLPALPAGGEVAPAVQVFARRGRLLYESLEGQAGVARPVPLDALSLYLQQATIATEDAGFFQNPGVDPGAVLRAMVQNLRSGRIETGASTITQQLARMLYFSAEERAGRSLVRKLKEAALALRLTRSFPKDAILEAYLNRVYYGGMAYGAEAAAQVYFGKPARDLDLAEAAMLAGLPQAPAAYNPLLHPEAAAARQAVVLDLMVQAGAITPAQAAQARAERLRFAPAAFPILAPHFVMYVREVLERELGPDLPAGLRVTTTLDLDLQRAAEAVVRRHLAALEDRQVGNAALVALDPHTGEVLVLVGSADYFDAERDGAVNVALALRQPGSAIKPITYAAALARGFTPATTIYDTRTVLTTRHGEPYTPKNYDRVYHGPVTLRQALGSSYNMPAVKVLAQVGLGTVLDLARDMGLTTFGDAERYDLSLTLGGGEVRLLELTAAYSVLAAGGVYREPVALLRVEDAAGRVLFRRDGPQGERRALSPQVAYLITDILADQGARLPAFGEDNPLRLTRPAAAKTGTTQDFRDNWTVGYTPDLVAGVWVGNADNRAMREVSGITGAGPIWHDFMEEALRGSAARRFPVPDGIISAEVCDPWGLRPGPWCPSRRVEQFIAGTEPAEVEQVYRAVPLCLATGELAGPECPGPVVQRVYEYLPEEAALWARDQGLPPPPELPDGRRGAEGLAVRLVRPDPGATVLLTDEIPREHQRLELEAWASGPAPIDRVEFYDGPEVLAVVWEAPYRLAWPVAPGRHAFRAVAHDAAGVRSESAVAPVTVVAARP
ncbi:MAG: PBP1A family penicillin-binding protein [Chloroflexi bacterium]|nr:PBP1A family penicillin-binding protein [Chloroflexota bacterium]